MNDTSTAHFFCFYSSVALHQTIENTVTGMGYELVEVERLAGGLLRVTIDWPWQPGQVAVAITVDDCERVTRQLQFTLEVENVNYARLEVSSPGIDRLNFLYHLYKMLHFYQSVFFRFFHFFQRQLPYNCYSSTRREIGRASCRERV